MYEIRKDFEKLINFVLKLETNADATNDFTTNTGINTPKKTDSNIAPLHRNRKTKYKSLETFTENIEKELFNPENAKIARNYLKDEKKASKEIKL